MKKPVLVIGMVMFGLFLYQVAKKEKWGIFYNEKLIPTSCKAVIIKLDKRIPANWRTICEGNNLAVVIDEVAISKDATNLKQLMYRQLVNHMSFVAKISPQETLERVFFVRFHLSHPKMDLDAVTEGKFIVKLATLENPDYIKTHLLSTVQVKETIK